MRTNKNINNYNSLEQISTKEIDIKHIFLIIRNRFWVIVVFSIIAIMGGYFYLSNFHTLLYNSSTRIILDAQPDYIRTLQVIIRDPAVLEGVIEELNLNKSPEGLAGQIKVDSIDGSQVIKINVVDTNPKMAANIANSTATVFKREIATILDFNGVTILSNAKVEPFPINDNKLRTLILGIIVGIVVGVGFIFLLESLDNTLKTDEEIQSILGIPVLGSVSKINKKNTLRKKIKLNKIKLKGETIDS
ncbi:YveK family protein [Bacillus sp. 1P02SD]|uniref:YveK family protein n=1 Tax=Bacillus sp. 1P02SD TaxID=3132264 RepID=UPI00399F5594